VDAGEETYIDPEPKQPTLVLYRENSQGQLGWRDLVSVPPAARFMESGLSGYLECMLELVG